MAFDTPLIDFDPYALLDLERECTDVQIVKAFRRAALKWHPDKNPDRKQAGTVFFCLECVSKKVEGCSECSLRSQQFIHKLAVLYFILLHCVIFCHLKLFLQIASFFQTF